MLDQETESSRPRDFPGRAVTAYFRAVQKRASGIGAGVKLMQLLELRRHGPCLRVAATVCWQFDEIIESSESSIIVAAV